MLTYFLLVLVCLWNTCFSDDCHRGLSDVKSFLGSKTPYRFVAFENTNTVQFDGCHPEKIIGFIRHGTRTPGQKNVKQMKQDLPVLKTRLYNAYLLKNEFTGNLCPETAEKIFSWQPKVDNDKKLLTHEGEDEMIDLAERLLNRFPQLLTQDYSSDSYFFKHTRSQRTAESARYFTIGLFGRFKSYGVYFPESIKNDPILRFYKGCEKWKTTIKKNPRAFITHFEFVVGNEMLKTCEAVSRRLGLNYTLTFDDINHIYTTCKFETAWNKTKISPWCSVFSKDDFEVLLYAADMKHYWIDGYGHELNYKVACPAVKHVFSYLESDSPSNASAVFYFTHSGTLLKLITHLGLYNDSYALTSSLDKDKRSERKWKPSYIDAFGTNLIFISYNCDGEKRILTLHQERPVQIPGCPESGLCPLTVLMDTFRESFNNCNMQELCSL